MNFKKIIANTLAALAVAAITTAGFSAPASVEAAETAAPATRKVVKDGKFLIETANGTFTAAGAQVK